MTRSIPVRVNQPPRLHQLAVLSTGWATFFHPVPDTPLTNIGAQSNLFSCWPLTFLFSHYFLNLTYLPYLPTYLPIYPPINLTSLLPTYLTTYIPAYLPIYLHAYLSAHPLSYVPLTQCQHSMMDVTIWMYCNKIIHNHFSNIWSLMTIKCYRTLMNLLHRAFMTLVL
jgi:hypothetical protein